MCTLVALQPMVVTIAEAQEVVIDPSGNVGFAPTLQRSSRPQVVDIARPNAGGVSHNQYTRFDVTSKGVVLNNSTGQTTTQLAGTVTGNTNLNGTAAGVIVNEVRSASGTVLNGSVEVAGSRADVIIANPSGLNCNGCNFINTDTVTLSTGTPTVNGGTVTLNVTGGAVTVGRNGLNGAANGVANVNLVGRTVVIDGKVTALNGLNVLGGAMTYNATTGARTGASGTLAAKPVYAVDGTAFGAMEAGRIQVIGTESGLGVRTIGNLSAGATDVTVSSQGAAQVTSAQAKRNVVLSAPRGAISVERDVTAATGAVTLSARDGITTSQLSGLFGETALTLTSTGGKVTISGDVQSSGAIAINGPDLSFQGYALTPGQVSFALANDLTIEAATIVANNVNVQAVSGAFSIGNSAVFSQQNVVVGTASFALGENVVVDGATSDVTSNLVVQASGDFHNNADLRRIPTAQITYGGALINEVGGYIEKATLSLTGARAVTNAGVLSGTDALTFNLASFTNTATGVVLSKTGSIVTTGALTNEGLINFSGDVTLTAGTVLSNAGFIQSARAYLNAPTVRNTASGELRATTLVQVAASSAFSNAGQIGTLGTAKFTGGTFANTGTIIAETALNAANTVISNDGSMTSKSLVQLVANAGDVTNRGSVTSYSAIVLSATGKVVNTATLIADRSISVTGPVFDNKGANALTRTVAGAGIATETVLNSGQVFLINDYNRNGNITTFTNTGTFATAGSINLKGRDSAARFTFGADSVLMAGLLAGDAGQSLLAGEYITLNANSISQSGQMAAGGNITLTGPDAMTLAGSIKSTAGSLFLTAPRLTIASQAELYAAGMTRITSVTSLVNDGALVSGSYLELGADFGSLNNRGVISASYTRKFDLLGAFSNAGVFSMDTSLSVSAASVTNTGQMQAGTTLTATSAAGILNRGVMTSVGAARLTADAGTVNLDTGSYFAASGLNVTAVNMYNRGGVSLNGTSTNTWALSGLYNQTGDTYAGGAIRVNAGTTVATATDSLLGSGSSVTVAAVGAATLGGRINGTSASISADSIAASASSAIIANGNVNLTSAKLFQNLGEVAAGSGLTVNTDTLDLRGNLFGSVVTVNVNSTSTTPGAARGNIYATDKVRMTIIAGLNNYGLIEAQNSVVIAADRFSNEAAGSIRGTNVNLTTTAAINNAGTVFAARDLNLKSGSLNNTVSGKLQAVSLGATTTANGLNAGLIDVYGFFGNIGGSWINTGTLDADSYVGIKATSFAQEQNGITTSRGHAYIDTSAGFANRNGSSITANQIDIRAAWATNEGLLRGNNVVNIADIAGAINNTATGEIHSKRIGLLAGTWVSNTGTIGQVGSNSLPVAQIIDINTGTGTFTNGGRIIGEIIRVDAETALANNAGAVMNGTDRLSLTSRTGNATNRGTLYGGDVFVRADAGQFNNEALMRATDSLRVLSGTFRNVANATTAADIAGQNVQIKTTGAINNAGRLAGLAALQVQSTAGNIANSGTLTGPEISVLATAGTVTSTTAISAGSDLRIEGTALNLAARVQAANGLALKSTTGDITLGEYAIGKITEVDAARNLIARSTAVRGTTSIDLLAGNIVRSDVANTNARLAVLGGTLNDVAVTIRTGDFGAHAETNGVVDASNYQAANITTTGSFSLRALTGDIYLTGKITAGDDIVVEASDILGLRGITLTAADTLRLDGNKYLRKHGTANLNAGNSLELLQGYGWFYTTDWLPETFTNNLSVFAKRIVINSDLHSTRDITLRASDNIVQRDHIVLARGITYSAGNDVIVDFNPFDWRASNPGATNAGIIFDINSAGMRGHTIMTAGGGLNIYAGNDINFISGKIQSGQDINLVAGGKITVEPFYVQSDETARPASVGWSFSPLYRALLSGHSASNVNIEEFRAYETRMLAARHITMIAGEDLTLIGASLTSNTGNITLQSMNGAVIMAAAPGFWEYEYRRTTTKRKWYGKKTVTTVTLDAYEDLYKPTDLTATNGNIMIASTRTGSAAYEAIVSAGTQMTAKNLTISTANTQGNITLGTYQQVSSSTATSKSRSSWLGIIPLGRSSSTNSGTTLLNFGNDLFADDILTLRSGRDLTIIGGSLTSRRIQISAVGKLTIQAAIDSTRSSQYSQSQNLITITTIQQGFDRETAALPAITASGSLSFDIGGDVRISGYAGASLNSSLLSVIGTQRFSDEMLNLNTASQQASANTAAATITNDYSRAYTLPTAADGAQFAYLDTLRRDYNAQYDTIMLRDHTWYDKQVQLTPAFQALLSAAMTYVTGGISNVFLQAAVSSAGSTLIGGAITGTVDLGDVLRGAVLAGASSTVTSFITSNVNLGNVVGITDSNPIISGLSDRFTPNALLDRFGDQVISAGVSNTFNGQNFFAGLDSLGRTFIVSESMGIIQHGIGDLGVGTQNWEGSLPHLLLHGGLGCIAIEVMNGNCASGFFAGASQSLLAGSNLTNEQKIQLAPLVGSMAGFAFAEGLAIGVSFSGTIAQSGLVNNFLTHVDIENLHAALLACEEANAAAAGSCNVNGIVAEYRSLSDSRNLALERAMLEGDTTFLQWAIANTATGTLISDLGPILSNENGQIFFDLIEESRTGIQYNGNSYNYVGEAAFEALKDIALRTGDADLLLEASLNYIGPSAFAPNIGALLGRGFHAVMVGGQMRVRGPTGRIYSNPNELPPSAYLRPPAGTPDTEFFRMAGSLRLAAEHSSLSLRNQASYNYRIGGATGTFTRAQADAMGQAWVGPNYRVTSGGYLESLDGLRMYRPPVFKPGVNAVQANLQQRPQNSGTFENANGHIWISD